MIDVFRALITAAVALAKDVTELSRQGFTGKRGRAREQRIFPPLAETIGPAPIAVLSDLNRPGETGRAMAVCGDSLLRASRALSGVVRTVYRH